MSVIALELLERVVRKDCPKEYGPLAFPELFLVSVNMRLQMGRETNRARQRRVSRVRIPIYGLFLWCRGHRLVSLCCPCAASTCFFFSLRGDCNMISPADQPLESREPFYDISKHGSLVFSFTGV